MYMPRFGFLACIWNGRSTFKYESPWHVVIWERFVCCRRIVMVVKRWFGKLKWLCLRSESFVECYYQKSIFVGWVTVSPHRSCCPEGTCVFMTPEGLHLDIAAAAMQKQMNFTDLIEIINHHKFCRPHRNNYIPAKESRCSGCRGRCSEWRAGKIVLLAGEFYVGLFFLMRDIGQLTFQIWNESFVRVVSWCLPMSFIQKFHIF